MWYLLRAGDVSWNEWRNNGARNCHVIVDMIHAVVRHVLGGGSEGPWTFVPRHDTCGSLISRRRNIQVSRVQDVTLAPEMPGGMH